MRETIHKIGTGTETKQFLAMIALAMVLSTTLVFAATPIADASTGHNSVTSFMIYRNVSYGNGTQCINADIIITNLDNIGNYGTGTMNIEYDPSVVHVTDITSSSDLAVVAKNIDNTTEFVRISAWNLDGVSGDSHVTSLDALIILQMLAKYE